MDWAGGFLYLAFDERNESMCFGEHQFMDLRCSYLLHPPAVEVDKLDGVESRGGVGGVTGSNVDIQSVVHERKRWLSVSMNDGAGG